MALEVTAALTHLYATLAAETDVTDLIGGAVSPRIYDGPPQGDEENPVVYPFVLLSHNRTGTAGISGGRDNYATWPVYAVQAVSQGGLDGNSGGAADTLFGAVNAALCVASAASTVSIGGVSYRCEVENVGSPFRNQEVEGGVRTWYAGAFYRVLSYVQ